MNRVLLSKCLIVLTLLAVSFQACPADAAQKKKKSSRPAVQVTPINQQNPKYASIVIDAETGTILSQDSADALRHPASLTKMMTLLMVFEAIDSGRLQKNQSIRVSQRAASMPASKLGLKAGSTIKLQDAIMSVATESANDMAVALAEAVSGSESDFALKMNAKASAIGMSRTKFYNASGLPNKYQVTTARDMARLARYMLANHPSDSRVFSKQQWYYQGRTYTNHNRLMGTYEGMDCCKTGFINASGFNLVASAKQNGRRIIGVVFGGHSPVTRNVHMAGLLDRGFEKAKQVQMASAKAPQTNAQPQPYSAVPPEKNIVLASVATEHQIIQEAYINASETKQANPALHVRKLDENQPQAGASLPSPSQPQSLGTLQTASLTPNPYASVSVPSAAPSGHPAANTWSIQIGAYQTRAATDQAIYQAEQRLPAHLKKNQSVVVPLRTADASWMFRARLSGYSQHEANEACLYFKDCLTISPQAY